MIESLVIVFAIICLYRALSGTVIRQVSTDLGGKSVAPQVIGMLDYAGRLFAERKYLAAEKAYLRVLKLDHKNITAYTRLGAIYIAQKNFSDAIECFRVASQIAPNAGTFQLLGQAFYENKNYIKAIAAIEKAIMFEPSATRFAILARAYSKIANYYKAVTALERAVDLDPTIRYLGMLADAYEATKDRQKAQLMRARVKELQAARPHPAPGTIIGGPVG